MIKTKILPPKTVFFPKETLTLDNAPADFQLSWVRAVDLTMAIAGFSGELKWGEVQKF